jgi:hypothetical protein
MQRHLVYLILLFNCLFVVAVAQLFTIWLQPID